jgi:hypothetical protein
MYKYFTHGEVLYMPEEMLEQDDEASEQMSDAEMIQYRCALNLSNNGYIEHGYLYKFWNCCILPGKGGTVMVI